jgi:hypothetical protein
MDLNRKERTVLADKMAQSFTDKRSAGSGFIAKKPAETFVSDPSVCRYLNRADD